MEYKAGKASYVLTVKNPNLPGYSAEKPFTVAQAIEACTADGPKDIFVKGIITSVESFNSTYGSLTYYIAGVCHFSLKNLYKELLHSSFFICIFV
ncbi:MAG: hypothetical protein K2I52_02535, partial [Muribaculaceae bacterium]|nr:hypothetical protein [Muribaculaceae bacterium]